jgi:hypothetical protein
MNFFSNLSEALSKTIGQLTPGAIGYCPPNILNF